MRCKTFGCPYERRSKDKGLCWSCYGKKLLRGRRKLSTARRAGR